MPYDPFESDQIVGRIYDGRLVRRLLRAIMPYRGLVVLALIFLAISTSVDLLLPYLTKIGIDRYLARLYQVYEAPPAVCDSLVSAGSGQEKLLRVEPGTILLRRGFLEDLPPEARHVIERRGHLSPETYYLFPEESKSSDVGVVRGAYWLVPDKSLRRVPPAVLMRVRGADRAGMIRLAWLTAALIVISFFAGYGNVITLQIAGQRSMYDLRMGLFRHLQGLSLEFFDKNPVGRLVTRVTNDIDALNEFFTTVLLTLLKDVLLLGGTLVILFSMNLRLALVASTVIPLLVLISGLFAVKVRGAFREVRRLLAQLNANLAEDLSGIKVIQIFRREKARQARYQQTNLQYFQAGMRQLVLFGIFRPSVELLSTIGLALVLIYGGGAVLRGALTLGALVAFITYTRQMLRPVADISEKYNILQSAMASAERVYGLLDTPPRIVESKEVTLLPDCRGRIDFEHVSFAYSADKPVLKDVSFTVDPGRSVALVGPTGAGKTSIISLLCRFYDVNEGRVLLDGVDLRDLRLRTLRDNIAVVLQDSFVFSRSVEENIRLGAPVARERVAQVAGMVQASDFITELPGGYDEVMAERGATLSTGQKQLLCFARALARDPRVLVLDEATSSVDPTTERLTQRAIETLMRGRTSIIVAHRLSTIQRVDEILVIDDGRIVERGNHQELLARRGIYYNLYLLQYREG